MAGKDYYDILGVSKKATWKNTIGDPDLIAVW